MSADYSFATELERKVLDSLEKLIHAKQAIKITQAQYEVAAQTLWDATAGLVSKETMELMQAALPSKTGARDKRTFLFVKPRNPFFVQVVLDGATVLIRSSQWQPEISAWQLHDRRRDFSEEIHPERQAAEFVKLTAERFINSGFVKV